MAFKFNWPNFDREFYRKAKEMLTVALNKGDKPDNIVDHIRVTDLYLGAQPPDVEMLELSEVSEDKFRGIFKLTYSGDAYLIMQTKVQVNPIKLHAPHRSPLSSPGILAAHSKLVVPLQLKISRLKLRGIVTLVVSKNKGLTFCFKNDPLDHVAINSSFDHLPNIRRDLQEKIEKQLRNLLNDELPSILHRLSLEIKGGGAADAAQGAAYGEDGHHGGAHLPAGGVPGYFGEDDEDYGSMQHPQQHPQWQQQWQHQHPQQQQQQQQQEWQQWQQQEQYHYEQQRFASGRDGHHADTSNEDSGSEYAGYYRGIE